MNTYKEIERLREEEYNTMKITTEISGKQYEAVIDVLGINGKVAVEFTEVPAKPTYDRMACLRGEWEPIGLISNQMFYFVGNDKEVGRLYYWHKTDYPKVLDGSPMFPTRELAVEFLQIEKRTWLPKEGDNVCGLNTKTWEKSDFLYEVGSRFDNANRGPDIVYFPSKKQREDFIAKQGPKMPSAEELLRNIRRLNLPVITDASGEIHVAYLSAALKSRALGTLIRSAEQAMGATGKMSWFIQTHGESSICTYETTNRSTYGTECFYTCDGAYLYKQAMGDDIKHLLVP
jgi:hypothetical protein